MKKETIDGFLTACRDAQRIVDMLPPLPYGLTRRESYVVDAICELEGEGRSVRVSDVSERLHVTRPSITKTISKLEEEGLVEKRGLSGDGRVVLVNLTDKGRSFHESYVDELFAYVGSLVEGDVSEENLETTASTIERVRVDLSDAREGMERVVSGGEGR